MPTSTTPELIRDGWGLFGARSQSYVSIKFLDRFLDVPRARHYQLEFSSRQWPDQSGTALEVKFNRYKGREDFDGTAWWYDEWNERWTGVYPRCIPHLRKVGCEIDRRKTIYFRLLWW